MYLFVSGATTTVNSFLPHRHLGKYLTPRANCNKNYLSEVVKQRIPFGADNDCYKGFDRQAYEKMIEILPRVKALKYVTLPDVVADYEETLRLFDIWYPLLKNEKLPLSFVLQDNIPINEIPFDKISSLFIGCTTEGKLSQGVADVVKIARDKGKWVHMGRVNSQKRMIHAHGIGCHSVDGTAFSMYPKTHLPWALRLLKDLEELSK